MQLDHLFSEADILLQPNMIWTDQRKVIKPDILPQITACRGSLYLVLLHVIIIYESDDLKYAGMVSLDMLMRIKSSSGENGSLCGFFTPHAMLVCLPFPHIFSIFILQEQCNRQV